MSPARRTAAAVLGLLAALSPWWGLTPPAAAATAVPVNCNRSPVEIRWDDLTYELDGTCGVVKVLADDVVVRMPTATRVVVRGARNTVVTKSLGRLVVRGHDQSVRPTSVRGLVVSSPGTTVEVDGLLEKARLAGRRTTVTADRAYTVHVPGHGNTLRARMGYDAGVAGDDNMLRYQRLDALTVSGDDNSVGVRRGATSVSVDGHRNRVRVARRAEQ